MLARHRILCWDSGDRLFLAGLGAFVSDLNLYPPHNPKTRRRGTRKPRPPHLPPHQPDSVRPENEAVAKKQISSGPAASVGFGASRGAGNALLFHQLKTAGLPQPKNEQTTTQADCGEGDVDE